MIVGGNKEVVGIAILVAALCFIFIVYLLNRLDGINKTGKRKTCSRPLQSR
jgi:hypothetical protein